MKVCADVLQGSLQLGESGHIQLLVEGKHATCHEVVSSNCPVRVVREGRFNLARLRRTFEATDMPLDLAGVQSKLFGQSQGLWVPLLDVEHPGPQAPRSSALMPRDPLGRRSRARSARDPNPDRPRRSAGVPIRRQDRARSKQHCLDRPRRDVSTASQGCHMETFTSRLPRRTATKIARTTKK